MHRFHRECLDLAKERLAPYGGHAEIDHKDPPKLVLSIGAVSRKISVSNTPGRASGALHGVNRDIKRMIREMIGAG